MKKRSWGSIRKQMAMLATATAMAMTSVITVAPVITAHADEEECGHVVLEDATKWKGSGEWTADKGGTLAVFLCEKCGFPHYYDNDKTFYEIKGSFVSESEGKVGDVGIGPQQSTKEVLELNAKTGEAIEISKFSKDGKDVSLLISDETEGWSEIAAEMYTNGDHITSEVTAAPEWGLGTAEINYDRGKGLISIPKGFSEPGRYVGEISVKLTPYGGKNPVVEPFSFPVAITVTEDEIVDTDTDYQNLFLEKNRDVTVGDDVSISLTFLTEDLGTYASKRASVYYFVSSDGGKTWNQFGEHAGFSEKTMTTKEEDDETYSVIQDSRKVPTDKPGNYLYGAVVYVKGRNIVNRPRVTDVSAVYYTDEKLIEYIRSRADKETAFRDVVAVLDFNPGLFAPADDDTSEVKTEKGLHYYARFESGKDRVFKDGANVAINVGAPVTYSPRTTAAPQPEPAPEPAPQPQVLGEQRAPEPVPEVLGVTRVQTPQTGLADKPMFYIVMMGVSAAVAVTGIVIKSRSRAQRRRK